VSQKVRGLFWIGWNSRKPELTMGTNHHYETEDRLHHAGAKARSAGSRKIPALPEMEPRARL
jgi:hypothetical protein